MPSHWAIYGFIKPLLSLMTVTVCLSWACRCRCLKVYCPVYNQLVLELLVAWIDCSILPPLYGFVHSKTFLCLMDVSSAPYGVLLPLVVSTWFVPTGSQPSSLWEDWVTSYGGVVTLSVKCRQESSSCPAKILFRVRSSDVFDIMERVAELRS